MSVFTRLLKLSSVAQTDVLSGMLLAASPIARTGASSEWLSGAATKARPGRTYSGLPPFIFRFSVS
jgi:hypothetical protein